MNAAICGWCGPKGFVGELILEDQTLQGTPDFAAGVPGSSQEALLREG